MARPKSALLRTPGARSLGNALRTARTNEGVSTRELGRRLGSRSAAWVLNLERGEVMITPELVAAIAGALALPERDRERLVARARDLGASPWTPSADLPDQLTTLIGYEREASRITELARIVPGLLQTEDYARAMIAALPGRYDVDELIRVRMERQSVLTSVNAPKYRAMLDESVLRKPIGGHAVMAGQLAHLLEVASAHNVEILIIADDQGAYPGMSAPFTLLEFEDTDPVVYVELMTTGTWINKPGDTVGYLPALDRLATVALSSDESMQVVAKYRTHHEGQAPSP
ncbi:helix-turn-helix domain-containing protein [Actinoalloteichus hymeniacidonis]|nr:helix-turn-helix transcriptional regulator [Actinoalloteichus hymeniacidonis]